MSDGKVHIRDLTAGQMEDIEDAIGPYPWTEVGKAKVLITIATFATGEPREKFKAMKLDELGDLVVFDDGEVDPNPEGAPAPSE